jgi:hypothetical protein
MFFAGCKSISAMKNGIKREFGEVQDRDLRHSQALSRVVYVNQA